MKYTPHDDTFLTWESHLLIVDVYGPVNKEGAVLFSRKIENVVKRYCREKWARIEVFHGEVQLGTSETFELLRENIAWSKKHGCQCIVLVNANILLHEIFSHFCDIEKVPLDLASRIEEAKTIARRFDR